MHSETYYTNKNIQDIKIALLSDIHFYTEYKDRIFCRLLKQIKKNKPNYIAIVGDILDSSNITDITRLINFFKSLGALAPTIVVKGNHDEKTGYMNNWYFQENEILIKELKKINNVHFLNDDIWQDNNITFYGFNLSYNHYECEDESYESFCEEVNKLKCQIPKDTYNITLFHSPINIYNFIQNNSKHNLNNSDLILSGHMHNGCLPFIITHPINKIFKTSRSLISPNKTLFPKFSQGRIYTIKDGFVYEGVNKLSNSTKKLHKFDFIFQKNVEFLTIKKSNKN